MNIIEIEEELQNGNISQAKNKRKMSVMKIVEDYKSRYVFVSGEK